MLPAPWGLGALPALMPGCKQQCVLGFPAPGYFAAALVAAGGGAAQQLASTHGFVSEGQPMLEAACGGSGEAAAAAADRTKLPKACTAMKPAAPSAAAEGLVFKPSSKLASSSGVVPAWIEGMLATTFFGPCETHRALKKNECTFFCASPSCGATPRGLCQHCVSEHAGHQVIQIRRYVYCDVIRAVDISQYMDTAGVQCYVINQAKVMFLNPRPQSKVGAAGAADTCRSCARHLREGSVYCCLACKVAALQAGDAWLPTAASHTLTPGVEAAAACGMASRPGAAVESGSGSGGTSSTSCVCGGVTTAAAAAVGGKRLPLAAATVALLQALHTSSDEEEEEEVHADQQHREVSPPAAKRQRGSSGTPSSLGPSTPGARVPARMMRQVSSDCEADISVAAALFSAGGGGAVRPPAAPPPAAARLLPSCGSGGLSSRRKQNSPRKSAV